MTDEATKLLREIRQHAVFRPDDDDPSCLRGQLVTIAELCDAYLSRAPAEAPPREPTEVASPARLRLAAHVIARGGAIPEHGALLDAAANRIESLTAAIAEGKPSE